MQDMWLISRIANISILIQITYIEQTMPRSGQRFNSFLIYVHYSKLTGWQSATKYIIWVILIDLINTTLSII